MFHGYFGTGYIATAFTAKDSWQIFFYTSFTSLSYMGKDTMYEIPFIKFANDAEKNAMYSQTKNTGKFYGKLSSMEVEDKWDGYSVAGMRNGITEAKGTGGRRFR